MPQVVLYTKPHCSLCDRTRYHLQRLLAAEPDPAAWQVAEVSILEDQDLFAAYRDLIPVVVVDGGPPLAAPESLEVRQLHGALHPAAAAPPAAGPPAGYPYASAAPVPGAFALLDRLGRGFTRHWLALFNTGVGVFAGLPWLAPVFAKLGWWSLADPIYTLYMFFCHQLPERAGSLFGYQVAYCYRNTAIYTSIFLFGLGYAAAREGRLGTRWPSLLRPLRWQVFVLLLLPILIDGLSHMLGLRDDNAWFDTLTGGRFGDFAAGDTLGTLNWWLRVISGSLFGFAVVRLAYPWIGIILSESRSAAWAPVRLPPPEQPQMAAS